MDEITDPWYSLNWYSPSTLNSFVWENTIYLWAILLVPFVILIRWLTRYYFNQKLPVALVKSELKSTPLTLFRLLPDLILSLVVVLTLMALARPQKTNEKVEQWTEGIDIMLAIDISQSMQIEDFTPNRLDAAREV
ncbi:MAG TPA: hypothetical protein VIT44_04930, partial [Cyclobacteriaceae bacterium]